MIGQKGKGKSGKPRKKPAKRSLGVSKETRTAVLARSNHRCEKCGLMLAQGFFTPYTTGLQEVWAEQGRSG